MDLIAIALGGALGSVARYLTSMGVTRMTGASYPLGTLCVNVIGSFCMGFALVMIIEKLGMSARAGLFLMTGFLGGFTTFSAFSLEAYQMLQAGRMLVLSSYVIASVFLSIAALIAGVALARAVFG
jgi:CrcB protein